MRGGGGNLLLGFHKEGPVFLCGEGSAAGLDVFYVTLLDILVVNTATRPGRCLN